MFTGIIQCLGIVLRIKKLNSQLLIRIHPLVTIVDFKLGESIAVNGCCLTITGFSKDWFETYVSTETFICTNLKNLIVNSHINLERALQFNDRLGGHVVSGHIDELAKIRNIDNAGASKIVTLSVSEKNSKFLIDKGSIAIDGISLTIAECTKHQCKVNIIPETFKSTIASRWRPGYMANIEIDMLAKVSHKNEKQPRLSKRFLQNHGFL